MAQKSALTTGLKGSAAGAGVRVRTPGKYIVLTLFLPVALVALGAGIWLNITGSRSAVAALEYRKSDAGIEQAYFNLPEFLVDLSPDLDGRTSFMKMRVSIALDGDGISKSATSIDAVKPVLIERLTFFLRELRPEDFEGTQGMARVKREMLRRVNTVITPEAADDVIIEELVIQ